MIRGSRLASSKKRPVAAVHALHDGRHLVADAAASRASRARRCPVVDVAVEAQQEVVAVGLRHRLQGLTVPGASATRSGSRSVTCAEAVWAATRPRRRPPPAASPISLGPPPQTSAVDATRTHGDPPAAELCLSHAPARGRPRERRSASHEPTVSESHAPPQAASVSTSGISGTLRRGTASSSPPSTVMPTISRPSTSASQRRRHASTASPTTARARIA